MEVMQQNPSNLSNYNLLLGTNTNTTKPLLATWLSGCLTRCLTDSSTELIFSGCCVIYCVAAHSCTRVKEQMLTT